jgi:uncharacterized protein
MYSITLDEITEEGVDLAWEEDVGSLASYLNFRAGLRLGCVRCLEEFSYPLSSTFDLTLHPVKESASEEDVELTEDDMESNIFEGGEIHLSEIACEQIFLEIPYQPLCREDCRGLCPNCGKDLNLAPCGCRGEDTESGFAVLRKLKLDN